MKKAAATEIQRYLAGHQDEMVKLLCAAVGIESPSADPASQAPILDLFESELNSFGYRCRRYPGITSGGQLLAMPPSVDSHTHRQLLLGHCDTVWPTGTLEKMPIESREGRLHGPGVYDMKAGLVQSVFAIRSLRDLGMMPSVAPVLFINSDEEIGSIDSGPRIRRLAQCVDRAMVMEPSLGPQGRLKTARKGVGRFVITISGKAAHAGLDPEKGISAILELSHVVQALHALNDLEAGTTVNVGTIDGGVRPNVVAAESRAEVDVRVRTEAIARRVEHAIYAIKPTVPGTEIKVSGSIGRPPLERTPRNRKLWTRAQEAADLLGIEIDEGAAGGGSDGNWTSLHTPTLDGLGAVGDGAHALNEHVIEEKMPERAALLACLIMGQPISEFEIQDDTGRWDQSIAPSLDERTQTQVP
ncbi:MAG: M20 family metallopeptidase [Planctomycetales bacterium]|nr:M20 family metallopeptidase [Planctomycetales bacterium]